LHTYTDDKDETNFAKIFLPPICVDDGFELMDMFYANKFKTFTPFVLNTIFAGLNKKGLRDAVLNAYEESTGKSKISLTSRQSILLMSELNTSKINKRIKKIMNLNIADYKESVLVNTDIRYNEVDYVAPEAAVIEVIDPLTLTVITPGKAQIDEVLASFRVRTSADIHIYSEALQMGFILYVQFISQFICDDVTDYFAQVTSDATESLPTYDTLIVNDDVNQLACGLCITYTASEPIFVPSSV
jgi:hypothetical protein